MAFVMLRQKIDEFHMHEKALSKLGHDLDDWLGWDTATREMKLEFVKEMKD